MKKISKILIIGITITAIYFFSCSKKSSSSSTTPPNCSNPSDCITNTWYLHQYQANYNGSLVTIYARGANSNLANFDSVRWVFANNNNAWYIYSSSTTVFESGTWKILPDDKTVEIQATYPDTFAITSITPSALIIKIPFNHNYPNYDIVQIAGLTGLDTSKISAVVSTFGTTQ